MTLADASGKISNRAFIVAEEQSVRKEGGVRRAVEVRLMHKINNMLHFSLNFFENQFRPLVKIV